MSREAAYKFVRTMTFGAQPDWYVQLVDWYNQHEGKSCTTEEIIRAAAENGYGEFTEQEYHEVVEEIQEAVRRIR